MEKPNPWRKRLVLLITIILVVGFILRFLPVPFGSLQIRGTSSITVQNLIDLQLVRKPVNILQIDRNKLVKHISQDLRVKKVESHYALLATLVLTIQKEEPTAIVATQFGYGGLTSKGICIYVQPTVPEGRIPIITGVKLGNILLGDEVHDETISPALTFLGGLTTEEREKISEVNVGDLSNIIAYTTNGIRLHLGNGEHMEKKARLAMEMINDVREKNISIDYIDVNLESPFIKTH